MQSFQFLPIELLDHIIQLLDPPSLLALASTCTFLHQYILTQDRLWKSVCSRKFPLIYASLDKGEALTWMKEEMGRRAAWSRDSSRSTQTWISPTGANLTQVTCHPEYWRILTSDGLVSYLPRAPRASLTPTSIHTTSRVPRTIHTGIRQGRLYGKYLIGPGAGDDLIVFPLPGPESEPHGKGKERKEPSTPGPSLGYFSSFEHLSISPHTILPYIQDLFTISPALDIGHCYQHLNVMEDLLVVRGWNDLGVWDLKERSRIFFGAGWSYCAPRPLCQKVKATPPIHGMIQEYPPVQLALITSHHQSLQIMRHHEILDPLEEEEMVGGGIRGRMQNDWEVVWSFTSERPIEAVVWLRDGERLVVYGRHPQTWAITFHIPRSWPGKVREVCRFELDSCCLPLRLCPEEELFLSTPLHCFAEKVLFHSLDTGLLLTERHFERGTFSLNPTSQGTFLALRHSRLDVHTFRGGGWGERLYRVKQEIGAPGGLCSSGDAHGVCIWRVDTSKAFMVDLVAPF
ncbi:MAG: hypothetical protein DHS80DRAFT_28527 [Piptocephalis tieghemiana]|nr:MAG: hypothetical protein DHS80DRAFT_28527 [Piptocephalis tieghemiana]